MKALVLMLELFYKEERSSVLEEGSKALTMHWVRRASVETALSQPDFKSYQSSPKRLQRLQHM
eukprot:1741370-Amphidinium_carterae.2